MTTCELVHRRRGNAILQVDLQLAEIMEQGKGLESNMGENIILFKFPTMNATRDYHVESN